MKAEQILAEVNELVTVMVHKVNNAYQKGGFQLKMERQYLVKLILSIMAPVTMVQQDFQQCHFLSPSQPKIILPDLVRQEKLLAYKKTYNDGDKQKKLNRTLSVEQEKKLQKWIIQETNKGINVTQGMLKAKALEISKANDFVADRTWLKKFTNKYYGIKKLIHEWGPSYEYKKLGKKIKECKKIQFIGNTEQMMRISRQQKIIPTKHNLFREEEQEIQLNI